MGNYTVPEEIRKMKPVGSTVKIVQGKYYVYTNSRHKDIETGKWKTDSGKLIGRIIPSVGFVPRNTHKGCGTTCFDYGEYRLAGHLMKDDLKMLKECFTKEEAFQLFSLACMFEFEGYIGLKPSEEIYGKCLIAHDYPDLKYSYHRISGLLSRIGREEGMAEFQKKCFLNIGTVAVDGHVIPSDSLYSDLSFNGYKAREAKSEQMNLLVALDVNTHLPLATRVFPGYMVDKTDLTEFLDPLGSMENRLFIMDSGFYSLENTEWLKKRKADYIICLSSNLSQYKDAVKPMRGRLPQFLYTVPGKKTDLVEYHETKGVNGRKVILYKNLSEREKLIKEYMKNMEEGSRGHTEEGLRNGMKEFGTIVLETSLSADAREIYRLYKARWAIETYFDRIKNQAGFREINLSEYGTVQAVAFVMLLAGRIDERILESAKSLGKTGKGLVRLMSALKLFDNGKSISVCNVKKEHLETVKALGFSLDVTEKCLG